MAKVAYLEDTIRVLERNNEALFSSDATILFDCFIHIYLVFCLCYIYKMSWYSWFYVLKAVLDVRFKNK
jgi:hypothetical protein